MKIRNNYFTSWQNSLQVISTKERRLCVHLKTKLFHLGLKTKLFHLGLIDVTSISPSWHEEADGRLLLHVKHAADNGHQYVSIRTMDSDVVGVSVSAFSRLGNIKELWIDFGSGKHQRLIAVRDLCSQLSPQVCRNLPMFHSITGCDTVSAFSGIGKKGAWKVWMAFPSINSAFDQLLTDKSPDEESLMLTIQRFVVLLYDITSHINTVNNCRLVLFIMENRSIENIPPTENALCQHVKRATLQAVMWINCLEKDYKPPPPDAWGWEKCGEGYLPLWTTIPDVAKSCEELIACLQKTMLFVQMC